MKTEIDTGGPAFPVIESEYDSPTATHPKLVAVSSGLTMRDWFAGMALQGMVSNMPTVGQAQELLERPKNMSGWAYAYADAMIQQRSKAQ